MEWLKSKWLRIEWLVHLTKVIVLDRPIKLPAILLIISIYLIFAFTAKSKAKRKKKISVFINHKIMQANW